MNGNGYFGDKEILEDLLICEKYLSHSYNDHISEVTCQTLRGILKGILDDTHHIQQDICASMIKRGWYKIRNAPSQEIEMAKHRFDQLWADIK